MNRTAPLLALLALAACKSPETSITLASYNAGLAVGFVPAAVERTQPVADAIGAIDADVVCLQEVWAPDQVAAVKAAAGAFADQVFPDPLLPDISGDPACADGELDGLLTCAAAACSDVCADELVNCVFDNCALPFLGLDKTCQGCVQAEVGGTPEQIRDTCETQGTSYAYGASFGTGLLSKYPILSSDHTVLDSSTNRRGIIHATIDHPAGEVDVYCTHLSAVFAVIPYPRETGSWTTEQAAQIDILAEMVAAAPGAAVVLGDLNTGPAFSGGGAEVPENWAKVDAMGLAKPYESLDGSCTYCGDNPLVAINGDDSASVLIDHILLNGITATAAERILDGTIETSTCETPFTGALSDHYGVHVTADVE